MRDASERNAPAIPRTSVSGVGWPAIPGSRASLLLAMQFQLMQSEWWQPEILRQKQLQQAANLLAHAINSVPFYGEHFQTSGYDHAEGVRPESWAEVPLLQREHIQRFGDALRSRQLPPDHGRVFNYTTSGSTGSPIRFSKTEITEFFWRAFTLRDHLWHQRDLGGKLAVIRTTVKESEGSGWGPATNEVFDIGSCATLNIRTDIATQAAWLERQNPDYLLSHPSNILALAKRCLETGLHVPRLCQVRTFGETLMPDLREACLAAWGATLTDVYSAEEVGYIALQCPAHEHYHVQAESLLVEILDDAGRPCAPGEIGRVVLTTLHNFAMPLIR